jgi:hypothetical protein
LSEDMTIFEGKLVQNSLPRHKPDLVSKSRKDLKN